MKTNLVDAPDLRRLEQVDDFSEEAELLWLRDEHRQAELLWLKSLEMSEQVLGPEHEGLIPILRGLGVVLMEQGQAPRAETFFRRALWVREKRDGWWHHGVPRALHDLAWSCRAQKRYAEAEALLQRALIVLEGAQGSYIYGRGDRIRILEAYAELPIPGMLRKRLLHESRTLRAEIEDKNGSDAAA